jgi:chorismate-pyruvate lyase
MTLVAANVGQQPVGGGDRGHAEGVAAAFLAGSHFTMQHAGAAELSSPTVMALDPLLRNLLFTDGTVTRALEAQTLCRVKVEVAEQSQTPLPIHATPYLEVSEGVECLRRRVTMSTGSSTPIVWAESHILTERLPTGFVELIDRTPNGIGGSIERAGLESRRELLWFRLGVTPHWASVDSSSASALIRLYRIITKGRPALLICEAFAIEGESGVYRPLGWSNAAACAANGSTGGSSE